jgi:hypothetical protein
MPPSSGGISRKPTTRKTMREFLQKLKCEIGWHSWHRIRGRGSVVLQACLYCTAEKYEVLF